MPPDKALESERNLYDKMMKRRAVLAAALLLAVFLLFLLNISIGSSPISLKEIIEILITGEGEGHKAMIVKQVRLPMSLMALVVGACLAIGDRKSVV